MKDKPPGGPATFSRIEIIGYAGLLLTLLALMGAYLAYFARIMGALF